MEFRDCDEGAATKVAGQLPLLTLPIFPISRDFSTRNTARPDQVYNYPTNTLARTKSGRGLLLPPSVLKFRKDCPRIRERWIANPGGKSRRLSFFWNNLKILTERKVATFLFSSFHWIRCEGGKEIWSKHIRDIFQLFPIILKKFFELSVWVSRLLVSIDEKRTAWKKGSAISNRQFIVAQGGGGENFINRY